jgi:hypothetical protein
LGQVVDAEYDRRIRAASAIDAYQTGDHDGDVDGELDSEEAANGPAESASSVSETTGAVAREQIDGDTPVQVGRMPEGTGDS